MVRRIRVRAANRIAATRAAMPVLPPPFWLLFLMVVLARTAGFAVPFLTLFLSRGRDFTPEAAGAVVSFWGGGVLLANFAGGVLADRFGARPVLALSGLGAAACLALFPVLQGFAPLAAAAFALGLTADMARPAIAAVTAELVPPGQRIFAYNALYFGSNIGYAISPLIATQLALYGWSVMFGVEAAALVLYAALALVALSAQPVRIPAAGQVLPSMLGALSDRRLLVLFGVALVYYLIWQQAYVGLPLAMKDQGLDTSVYAFALTVNGVAVLLLTAPVTAIVLHWRTASRLVAGLLLVGMGFAAHAGASTTSQYALCVLIWTVGEILFFPASQEAAAEIAPSGQGATYQGVVGAGWGVAGLAGPALAGSAYAAVPVATFWLSCGGLAAVAAAAFVIAGGAKNTTDSPAREVPRQAPPPRESD